MLRCLQCAFYQELLDSLEPAYLREHRLQLGKKDMLIDLPCLYRVLKSHWCALEESGLQGLALIHRKRL